MLEVWERSVIDEQLASENAFEAWLWNPWPPLMKVIRMNPSHYYGKEEWQRAVFQLQPLRQSIKSSGWLTQENEDGEYYYPVIGRLKS